MSYLSQIENYTQNAEDYPKLLQWKTESPQNDLNCIGAPEAYEVILSFCNETGIDKDRVFALSSLMLALIPLINSPKIVADYSKDFNGIYDFQLTVDDYVKVLKNKKPTSKPRRDPKKKYLPEYKEIKVLYIFGLEYDPKTNLWKLRYKLYPQRAYWGFRYEEKYRSFEELLEFAAKDLVHYYREEQVDISIPDDPEEEDIPQCEEDL
jgi:hypothetical protein